MAIIDDAFLVEMATLGADLALKDDCEIQRNMATPNPDGWSNGAPDWQHIATVKALKMLRGGSTPSVAIATADRLSTLTLWQVLLPLGTDVQEQDRLIIKGETFQVEVIAQATYDVFEMVYVSEVA
jgi:hypothetical protein